MVLGFILALAALVLLHELGHFLAAKALGIEVEEFGLGLPPRLLTIGEWGGTRFTINLIPLGGFVRPKMGATPEEPDALRRATPPKRIVTLLAGPFMNLLIGVLLLMVIYLRQGLPVPGTVNIESVLPGSPAAQAGLQPGDRLLAINGQPITDLSDAHDTIYAHLGEAITLEIERQGQRLTLQAVPRENPPPNEGALGVLLAPRFRSVSPPEALWLGMRDTVSYSYALLSLPVKILRGQVEPNTVRLEGYRGMYNMYTNAVQLDNVRGSRGPWGTYSLLFYLQITLSLGLLNLLPIPALDGGRILLALAEWVTRRSLPLKWEYAINLAGFGLVLFLLIAINLKEWIP